MKVDTLAHVKNQFSTVLDHLGNEPLFITRNGKVAAVMQSLNDAGVEDYLMRNSPRFWRLIETRRAQAKSGKTVPFNPAVYAVDSDLCRTRALREKPADYKAKSRRPRSCTNLRGKNSL